MTKKPPLSNVPTTLRLSKDTEALIEEASLKMGLPKQDIIRLACAVGLEDLRRINYNLADAVVDKAKQVHK